MNKSFNERKHVALKKRRGVIEDADDEDAGDDDDDACGTDSVLPCVNVLRHV